MSSSQAIDQDMDSESWFARVESGKQRNQGLVAQADAQRMQLISPPPEEMLNLRRVSAARSSPNKSNHAAINATPANSVSKRKRGPPTPAKPSSSSSSSSSFEKDGTPRKSKKATVVKSPHLKNPNADFIPPMVIACDDGFQLGKTVVSRALKARGSRRSATPIPPYEPPPDVFSSPREVFLKPLQPTTVSKRSNRKVPVSSSKKGRALKVDTRHVHVKQELPDFLDLLAPMPPASPSDDPLLLKGRPKPEQSSSRMVDDETDEVVQVRPLDFGVSSAGDASGDGDLVKRDTSNWEMDNVPTEDNPPSEPKSDQSSSGTICDQTDEIQTWDFGVSAAGDGGWESSDEELVEDEGTYTGNWEMDNVQTEEDPPSMKEQPRPDQSCSVYDETEIQTLDFGVSAGGNGGWESSDEELVEDEGTYKGNWEMDNVQTEEDPPSRIEPEEISLPILDNQATNIHHETYPSQDDEDSDTDDEPGLVKITSVDPTAAARAVAILKQHDYDCYTKLIKKRRASRSPSTDGFAKETRRRSVSASGISKSSKHRRRATMGVIGDKVIIPGSPITTLPELLQKVEKEVANGASGIWSARTSFSAQGEVLDPFQTPPVNRLRHWVEGPVTTTPDRYPMGEREWSKDDWKLLDACFTDLRLESGDPGSGELAPVDFVNQEDVISRFLDLMGGQLLVDTFGEPWIRDNLLRRASALMKKQRSGNVAPPTTPVFSSVSPSTRAAFGDTHSPMFDVPEFTPLNHFRKTLSLPVLPLPDVATEDMAPGHEGQIRVPPTLFAPRYSHLLEEAIAVGKCDLTPVLWHNDPKGIQDHQPEEEITFPIASPDDCVADDCSDSDSFLGNEGELSSMGVESTTNSFDGPIPSTLRGRVKGFLASYLPTLSNHSKPSQKTIKPTQRGLPLPPRSVLEKSRGPVATPIRPPVPRVPHPKELVNLNPAPLPPTSHIPRPKVVPKRLVDLVPVPLPPPKELIMPRPRRSSTSSVKDLVKGFEQMDKAITDEMKPSGMQSSRRNQSSRPKWRP